MSNTEDDKTMHDLMVQKYPALFVKHYEESEESIQDGSYYGGYLVNVSKMAKLLGDRRKLDIPIEKMIKPTKVIWFKNKRYLKLKDAYKVWKKRMEMDKRSIYESVEDDDLDTPEKEAICPELKTDIELDLKLDAIKIYETHILIYAENEFIHLALSDSKVYLSVLDVRNIYRFNKALPDDIDKKEFTYCMNHAETTFVGVEANALFEFIWNKCGLFNPKFERWVKRYVRDWLGLEEDTDVYSYQNDYPFVKNYMTQNNPFNLVYNVEYYTNPFFFRMIVDKGVSYIALEDLVNGTNTVPEQWKRYSSEDGVIERYVESDDDFIEKLSFIKKSDIPFGYMKIRNNQANIDAMADLVAKFYG